MKLTEFALGERPKVSNKAAADFVEMSTYGCQVSSRSNALGNKVVLTALSNNGKLL